MVEIKLDNGIVMPLHGKKLLILPAGSRANNIINNEDDYDVIMIIAGIIELLILNCINLPQSSQKQA